MKLTGWAFALAVAMTLQTGCRQNEEATQNQSPSAPQVKVDTLELQKIDLESTWPGRVSALRTAQIRPQVGGIVTARLFSQGSEVVAGQPLFQIDPAPFKADVAIAEAALARVEASYRQVNLRAQRLSKLQGTGAISRQDYDDARANTAQAAAGVAEAKASLNRKKLELAYSTVRAPVSGRIDQQYVTEGALVSASDSQAMAIVQQTDRVYVDAHLPAAELRHILAETASGSESSPILTLTLLDESGEPYDVKTQLLFSGASVNDETGNVVLRAEAENARHQLMPGMYVRVRVSRHISDSGIVVPEQAVHHLEDKNFVWTIDEGNRAQRVQVRLGMQISRGQIVESGLLAGQQLVVEGQDKLKEGMQVQTKPWKTGV
ncbi:efflux RND transporter periplasmic adaptor subunit [Yersinia intermedia]|uniref:efflux RND transporter periplasmic adaptor subunit n=1 Tax=Yersinia intermedia TaxID=631 RepID=UPI0030CDD4B2